MAYILDPDQEEIVEIPPLPWQTKTIKPEFIEVVCERTQKQQRLPIDPMIRDFNYKMM